MQVREEICHAQHLQAHIVENIPRELTNFLLGKYMRIKGTVVTHLYSLAKGGYTQFLS